ncbi:hypothetical protein RJT34_03193 [Clitoria ternatea]|uniref:Uncharacterized protein n=1 Tax=Clitoria ternatea TaxID=43366 RepID=A0AAN9KL98_CLITE
MVVVSLLFLSISLFLCPPLVLYLLLSYASSFPLTHIHTLSFSLLFLFFFAPIEALSLSLSLTQNIAIRTSRRWLASEGIKVHTDPNSFSSLLFLKIVFFICSPQLQITWVAKEKKKD